MNRTPAHTVNILAHEDPLKLDLPAHKHGALGGDGNSSAVTWDLGRVVDEVLGGVGVVAVVEVVLDEDFVGENGQSVELLVWVGVRLGGAGAAKGIVFFGLTSGVCEGRRGEEGEEDSGDEGCGEHCELLSCLIKRRCWISDDLDWATERLRVRVEDDLAKKEHRKILYT